MNKLLVIDGNNLAHRAYNKYSKFTNSKGKSTSIVYGLPYILRSLIGKLHPTDVVVVFDGGKDPVRQGLLPDYKKRERREDFDYEDFIRQKNIVMKILSALGVHFIKYKDVEADDLIWLYSRRYKRLGGHVIIVSTDKDFNQLVSYNGKITVWNPWKDTRINHKNMFKLYGYNPDECVDWLSIVGDKSDNIPGLKGVGEKTMRKFLDNYGSILNYIKGNHKEESSKILSKMNVEEAWLLNRQLVDIRLHCRRHLRHRFKIEFKKSKPNKKELAYLCAPNSIKLFTEKRFLETFNY